MVVGSFVVMLLVLLVLLSIWRSGSNGQVASSGVFDQLNAVYARRAEPVPPVACRRAFDADVLARAATDVKHLAEVAQGSPEASYLLAREVFETEQVRHPALDHALSCERFAAALNLNGRVAFAEKAYDQARRGFVAALAAEPKFRHARFNLALLLVQTKEFEEAFDRLNHLIADDPTFGEAYLVRAGVSQIRGDHQAARRDACRAAALGVERARAECEQLLSPRDAAF